MASIYAPGTSGPWYLDDDQVRMDGIFSGLYIEGVATVDGEHSAIKRRHRKHRGMVGAYDYAPRVGSRDTSATAAGSDR